MKVPAIMAFVVAMFLCTEGVAQTREPGPAAVTYPELTLVQSVRSDGTATELWAEGISIAVGAEAARRYAMEKVPLGPNAEAWLQVLEASLPAAEKRAAELASLFDLPAIDAVVVAGNRGSADGFGWVPDHIGINVQAFVDTYGPPDEGAMDRMVRIVAHEYLHLQSYAAYPDHADRRKTAFDRALWTVFFEGIGDYVSVSSRWLPDGDGSYSPVAADTLEILEPVLVERLEALADAGPDDENDLRAGIASGRFDRKWGSLPYALWLHSEAQLCGEAETLQAVFRLERYSVLSLARRHAAAELQPGIEALQARSGSPPDDRSGPGTSCIADRR